jgi:hypothetical protein
MQQNQTQFLWYTSHSSLHIGTNAIDRVNPLFQDPNMYTSIDKNHLHNPIKWFVALLRQVKYEALNNSADSVEIWWVNQLIFVSFSDPWVY